MNPNSNETSPSFNLPEIAPEAQGQQPVERFNVAPSSEKQANIATEQSPVSTPPPMPQNYVQPVASADPAQTGLGASMPTGGGGLPQIADDTDLIEREWVDKAKEIVAQTAHDPYLQNKEVTKMKADYLKKRYNKDIKLVED